MHNTSFKTLTTLLSFDQIGHATRAKNSIRAYKFENKISACSKTFSRRPFHASSSAKCGSRRKLANESHKPPTIQRDKLKTYPRPDVNNFSPDRIQLWRFVTIPILSTSVYHPALVTLYHVSGGYRVCS